MKTELESRGDWLVTWDPEDPKKWDSKLAWNTLTITTVSLTLCFVAWFLPSAIIPKLNGLGFTFTQSQLRSEEHTSELQSRGHLVCRLLLEKKKQNHLRGVFVIE